MNVLITSVGTTTSIGVVKALRIQTCLDVVLYGIDTNPVELCAGASLVDHFSIFPSSLNKEEYQDSLLRYNQKHKIDCVIPIHDRELEAVSELSLSASQSCFFAVNTPEVIKQCNNKVKASKLAESLGITVPRIYSSVDEVEAFPIIGKPLAGVGGKGHFLIENRNDLLSFSQKMSLDSYFLQDYIIGDEYTVDCYSGYNSDFFSCLPRMRLEVKSGIVTKSKTCRNEELVEYCKKIHTALGFKGASNIQFIYSNDNYYFLEINPRFSGGGILSYTAGLHSPSWTLLEAKGLSLTDFMENKYRYDLHMTRYWKEVYYDNKHH